MAIWKLYQVDTTQYEDGVVREHSTFEYKDQALRTLESMLKYAASNERANETQPTRVNKTHWHLYIDNKKRSFIVVRHYKNYMSNIEARDRHLMKW